MRHVSIALALSLNLACGSPADPTSSADEADAAPDAPAGLCCATADAGLIACDPGASFTCKRERDPEPQCSDGQCALGDSCEGPTGSGIVTPCR